MVVFGVGLTEIKNEFMGIVAHRKMVGVFSFKSAKLVRTVDFWVHDFLSGDWFEFGRVVGPLKDDFRISGQQKECHRFDQKWDCALIY